MNTLTSRQRKLVYVGGIVILLIPIILLGLPAGEVEGSGGLLADLREDEDLGESTLGDVDPSSAAMNLVLLGLRGPAASVLHLQAIDLQETKNWGKLKTTVDQITKLQPHYLKIWEFQGWNLAYNVSAQWDATEDRYYWVKEGIKFHKEGNARNQKSALMLWNTGRLLGSKIGRSDEWRYFRRYFLVDPDVERFKGLPDREVNPATKDNWLAAKDMYLAANRVDDNFPQQNKVTTLFRQYPSRCQIDYAETMQREGKFDESTRYAWQEAYDDWTQKFGRETFIALDRGKKHEYWLEAWYSDEEMEALAAKNEISLAEQQWLVSFHQELVNYRYWRQLTLTEGDPLMIASHRHMFRGKELFREGRTSPRGENGDLPSEAREELEAGMQKLAEIFEKYPVLIRDEMMDDALKEEAMLTLQYWFYLHKLNNIEPPDEFPLKTLWMQNQGMVPDIQRRFQRETSIE